MKQSNRKLTWLSLLSLISLNCKSAVCNQWNDRNLHGDADDGDDSNPASASASASSLVSNYACKVDLRGDGSASGDVTFYYSLSGEGDDAFLRGEMVYKELGWVSWAVSGDSSGSMIGSEAIIGLPQASNVAFNPGKYSLMGFDVSGVQLMSDSMQTLVNASISQTDSSTVLQFSKKLQEPGEISIGLSGNSTFLWAVGANNDLSYHVDRNAFSIDLTTCASSTIDSPQYRNLWMSHGILAAIAWAVAAPLAILSALSRRVTANNDPLWFKAHFGLNVTCLLLTIAAYVIAVTTTNKSSGMHFATPHHVLGLVILIVTFFQIAAALVRPKVDKTEFKSKARSVWEMIHRLVGLFLLGASIYQVQSGISLFTSHLGAWGYWKMLYWIWIGLLVGGMLMGMVWVKCTNRSKKRSEPEDTAQVVV